MDNRNRMLGTPLLLAAAILLCPMQAKATTYTYNISFGDPHAYIQATGATMAMILTGTVITDCDNCAVYNPIYWSFTGNDGIHTPQTISSTDLNAHLTYSLPAGVVMPLTATSTGLYWNFDYHYSDGSSYRPRWDGSDPQMCFCVWLNPYDPLGGESHKFLMFHASPWDWMSYYFMYANDRKIPM